MLAFDTPTAVLPVLVTYNACNSLYDRFIGLLEGFSSALGTHPLLQILYRQT